MIVPGIVSVTFRKHTAEEIIAFASDASLKAIEWGADVHAKIDEPDRIAEVGKLTSSAGIMPISFGSYYWVCADSVVDEFSSVITAAKSMGASNIRAWAGKKGSALTDRDEFEMIVANIARCCDMAAESGLTVSFEYHPNTLTDCHESAVRLAKAVARDNFRLYWQPDFTKNDAENLAALDAVLPWISNVHVFSWEGAGAARYPLSHSRELFKACADRLKKLDGHHGMLLEFVKGDLPEQMAEDARELLDIIK